MANNSSTSSNSKASNNDVKHAFKAYIPDIFLELPNYKFHHHPIDSEDQKFFGRKAVLEQLSNILRSSKRNRGAYLVTGYRGMGKTSYVRRAISEYNKSPETDEKGPKKLIDHHISFAQNDLKELDILRQITKFIKEDLKKSDRLRYVKYLERKTSVLFYSCLTFIAILFASYLKSALSITQFLDKEIITSLLIVSVISGLMIYQVFKFILFIIRRSSSLGALVSIMRQIDILYDRCQGEVSNEQGVEGASEQLPLGFINRISKKYNPLGAKEAEHELIDILKKYENLNFYENKIGEISPLLLSSSILILTGLGLIKWFVDLSKSSISISVFITICFVSALYLIYCGIRKSISGRFKKEFIFVFDELDKIEPKTGKEYFSENIAASTNLHYDTYTNSIRERKELIIGLLSSLKYFVSEANSRFIFIAGREMFDASLADISDRQSSLSSIFHQVVYVDSFYRDSPDNRQQAAGIGEMVEEYLETILIPRKYIDQKNEDYQDIGLDYTGHFLSNYYKYISKLYFNKRKQEEEVLKIIFTLQNFIIYITYRSNGSPKKMVRLLEENIVSLKDKDEQYMIVTNDVDCKDVLYLKFSFKKQYKLGFTSYLFRPFLLMYGNFIRQYGDSLLVSTPYLIDNIIKFHPFAFSVKNLELLPEVISSNKSPELRSFIEKLVFFLSQNHIRETETGLFEHKFYDRTHNEIAFLSKVAEEESAAFNFSLDENYPIKKHLITRINELRTHHKDFRNGSDNFSGSLSFLHDLLGDAELYDDEFEDAIISYSDAIHVLNCPNKTSEFSTEQLILYVRFKLKIGLAHEKMKAYDIAMGHYSDSFQKIKEYIQPIGSARVAGDVPVVRELIQFASRSLAALIFVQEKLEEGLTVQKIKKFNQTFISLIDATGKKDYAGRDTIEAKHYTQIAIIAFYKNMTFPYNFDVSPKSNLIGIGNAFNPDLLLLFNNNPLLKEEYVQKSFDELVLLYDGAIFEKVKDNIERDFRFSFFSYVYYKKSLACHLSESQQSGSLEELIVTCFDLIYKFDNKHGKNMLNGIGNTLSRLGDLLFTLYRTIDGNSVQGEDVLKSVRSHYANVEDVNKSILSKLDTGFLTILSSGKSKLPQKDKSKIELDGILSIYYVSARFFLKAGRSNSGSFQFRKMIMLIKSFVKFDTPEDSALTKWLEDSLLNKMLEISSWNNNSADRPQILKYKDYFGIRQIQTPKNYSRFIYTNLSNNPEVKESILLLASLKVKGSNYLKYSSLDNFVDECSEQHLITRFNGVSHQLSRVMELELQVQINYKFMKESLDTRLRVITSSEYGMLKWEEEFEKIEMKTENTSLRDYHYENKKLVLRLLSISDPNCEDLKLIVKEYFQITANSIHCLHQIINILNTYGLTHFLNQSYLAGMHEKLGDWLKHLHLCKMLYSELEMDSKMDTIFNRLLGFRVINTLEVLPQYQLALKYYYEASQVHSEGAAYKFMIGNFIYLEDDYYDNLGHFGASLERQRINSGEIRKRINILIRKTKFAGILKYENLVNSEPFGIRI